MDQDPSTLFLPYPPSVNTYWGFSGHRRFLTDRAVEFKRLVAQEVLLKPMRFGDARLALKIDLYPPDRRARDLDNVLKPLIDALVAANVMIDDSQVDYISITRKEIVKKGLTRVWIGPL